MKLTKAQRRALTTLSAAESSSYWLGCSLGTIHALARRGLVRVIPAPGNFAFPQALASSGGRK